MDLVGAPAGSFRQRPEILFSMLYGDQDAFRWDL
jgi:hypothetical protein